MKRALLIGAGTVLFPALALAQATPPKEPTSSEASPDVDAPPAAVHIVDDSERLPPVVPRSRDLLSSHVLLGVSIGPTWSLGRLGSHLTAPRAFGPGAFVRADAGFGLSRYMSVGVWGGFAGYADGSECGKDCSGRAFAVGPFLRYHLSQGLRFNPWGAVGAAYRRTTFENAEGKRQKFSGVEWLHVELGADYYVFSGLAFGPYGSLGLSSYAARPDSAGDARVNAELSVGLRLSVDLPGR